MPAAAVRVPAVDFTRATSLALPLDFDAPHPRHFGAPAARSEAFRVEGFEGAKAFEGEVARGASCNCRSITLVPHCNGTHTESVSHLTLEQRPLHEFVPLEPIPALLLTVAPCDAAGCGEDSDPTPLPGDRVLTRAGLLVAWERHMAGQPRALLLRTGGGNGDNPPFLTRQLATELVERGIEHLVVDLPSVDRSADQGRLTAHRIFFGLPAGVTSIATAQRASCTITELASFPLQLTDGPCALQLQLSAFSGDAVPSRPLHLPLIA